MKFNSETGRQAGKKSSRKGVKSFATIYREALNAKANDFTEVMIMQIKKKKKLIKKLENGEDLTELEWKILQVINKDLAQDKDKALPSIAEVHESGMSYEDHLEELESE